MSTAGDRWMAHHPLLVLLGVVAPTTPGVTVAAIIDSILNFKEGPVGLALWAPLVAGPAACGLVAYFINLRLDPNVPRLALAPAAATAAVSSALACAAATVWLVVAGS